MKIWIKHLLVSIGLLFLFTQCEKETFEASGSAGSLKDGHQPQDDCVVVQDLWAGAGQNNITKGTLVGKVSARINGAELQVEYGLTAPWVLTEAHLWVGSNPTDIPKNAAPGQFPYKEYVEYKSSVRFIIDLSTLGIVPGDPVYIAAHGVVMSAEGVEMISQVLPINVEYKVTYFKKFDDFPGVAPLSYFQIGMANGFLAGNYKGWCVDTSTPITQDQLLQGMAYSSYGMIPVDLFNKPENLPALNWIINNIFVGDMSLGGFGTFTMGDLQRSFWSLLENDPNLDVPGGVGPYNNDRVAEIVERALEYGLDFEPICGQKMLIILVSPRQQTSIIEFPVSCETGSETAWAYGDYSFKKLGIANKWGWIFKIHCTE